MRNMALFGEPGHAYIYFNYGVHWMLNVTAHEPGRGAGVLIRAAEPIEGLDEMRANRGVEKVGDLLSGPGKLCRALEITKAENGLDLLDGNPVLRLEVGETVSEIAVGPRVGIAVGKGHETPWRFIDAARVRWASKPWPKAAQLPEP